MTRAATTASVNKNKTSSQASGAVKTKPYPLRGHTLKNTPQITPTKPSPTKVSANEPNPSPTPSTPTKKCSTCQRIEELRSYKLNEAVQEFSSKLESYKELSKSLGENSSDLNHAIATIKHFILHLKPSVVEDYFKSIESKVTSVSDNRMDLSNYVTRLDAIHELTGSTNNIINSKTISSASENKSLEMIDSRIQKLESMCSQLSTKLESLDFSLLQHYQKRFNDIMAENQSSSYNPPNAHTPDVPSILLLLESYSISYNLFI